MKPILKNLKKLLIDKGACRIVIFIVSILAVVECSGQESDSVFIDLEAKYEKLIQYRSSLYGNPTIKKYAITYKPLLAEAVINSNNDTIYRVCVKEGTTWDVISSNDLNGYYTIIFSSENVKMGKFENGHLKSGIVWFYDLNDKIYKVQCMNWEDDCPNIDSRKIIR